MKELILLGNPLLLEKSEETSVDEGVRVATELRKTLHAFQKERGWGRAISAPQIGELKRVIYLEYEGREEVFVNPTLSEFSDRTFEIWDDCLSFPDLLVKVRRHQSCRIDYLNKHGEKVSRIVEDAEAELLQHEFDHLEGIVATMRAVDGSAFALQSERHLLGGEGFANPLIS